MISIGQGLPDMMPVRKLDKSRAAMLVVLQLGDEHRGHAVQDRGPLFLDRGRASRRDRTIRPARSWRRHKRSSTCSPARSQSNDRTAPEWRSDRARSAAGSCRRKRRYRAGCDGSASPPWESRSCPRCTEFDWVRGRSCSPSATQIGRLVAAAEHFVPRIAPRGVSPFRATTASQTGKSLAGECADAVASSGQTSASIAK